MLNQDVFLVLNTSAQVQHTQRVGLRNAPEPCKSMLPVTTAVPSSDGTTAYSLPETERYAFFSPRIIVNLVVAISTVASNAHVVPHWLDVRLRTERCCLAKSMYVRL